MSEAASRPARHPGIGSAARSIAVLNLASRVAGFARTLVFAACVGTTAVGAPYQSANTVPNVVYEVAAGGILSAVAVPLLAGRVADGDRDAADGIGSALLTWAMAILVPVTVAVALAARAIAGVIYPPGDARDLAARMLLIFAPQIVLYGIGIVVTGILHAHRRFVAAALAPLISSIVVITTYLAYGALVASGHTSSEVAVAVLAWGTTGGVLALVATLIPSLGRVGVRLRPTFRFPFDSAVRARRLASAGLLALLAQQASVAVVLWLTNQRAALGTINAYQYVQATYLLPYAVLAVPIATAAFPVLAAGDGRDPRAGQALAGSLGAIIVLSGAAAAALIAAAPALGAFFSAVDAGRSGPGATALAALPTAMTAFAPGLVGFGVCALLTRALYVRGRARTASTVVAAGWVLAAVVPVVLTIGRTDTAWTLTVIGVGSSVGMTLAALGLLGLVHHAWGSAALAGLPRVVIGLAVGSVAGTLAARVLAHLLPDPDGVVAAVSSGVVTGGLAALITVSGVALAAPAQVRALRSRLGRTR
ncbi:MAG TPA: lipid II flippase MurJ [Tetrasphaera sp.]|uniref:murein biosynthesis integral membrane protein MurJ n=1 Tax=Nostocoides sp. TaxID=1917966 RepID=UPI002C328251|nr:lipid II flippase MurJ [Tetrasphaera sp.]HNQ08662.1 lipid II flippase MurJ [Tetrasphaera sp.]